MDFQPGSDRPVVNVHQIVLTVYAATDLGERSGEPRSLSVAKIIQRHRAGLLQSSADERHRGVRPLSNLLATPHLQIVAHHNHLLDPSWFVTHLFDPQLSVLNGPIYQMEKARTVLANRAGLSFQSLKVLVADHAIKSSLS